MKIVFKLCVLSVINGALYLTSTPLRFRIHSSDLETTKACYNFAFKLDGSGKPLRSISPKQSLQNQIHAAQLLVDVDGVAVCHAADEIHHFS